ncbi:hypothetical protein OMP43_07320 [Sphingomonas sp. CBMAI 2297]|uniref:hypothetical protein n=1 Tax=Sphingomonas sp. CBMAI 2297 TaxID=2991720 RepID=UPI002453EB2A|nr:hypothetical protein [Sphingomonas sp. CBMAI 2297]MDH4743823.1 hypothetical protein [Sphingomonas sp. CBMAI 2297]
MVTRTTTADSNAIVSLAFWLDLRRYGAMLNEARFDPTCPEAKAALGRLRRFQEVVAAHSRTTFPTLVINDGVVAYRDVGLTVTDRVWPFVERCWKLYQETTDADRRLGGHGLRGVLAAGMRAKGSNRGILAQNDAVARIIGDLADGRISRREAVGAAWRVRRVNDIVPQLQANFAFSRAYTAEQGARKGKLEGSRFYLETKVLRAGVPGWLTTGDPIEWEPSVDWLSTLSTTFVEVQAVAESPDRETAFRTGREMLASLRMD